jgi:hypothetical protein
VFLPFQPDTYVLQAKDMKDQDIDDIIYNPNVKESARCAVKAPAVVVFPVLSLGVTASIALPYGKRFYLNVRKTRVS